VAEVDDLKLTITNRMFMNMKWTDPRIIHNKTSEDELAILVCSFMRVNGQNPEETWPNIYTYVCRYIPTKFGKNMNVRYFSS
jgi:hypothetical protein